MLMKKTNYYQIKVFGRETKFVWKRVPYYPIFKGVKFMNNRNFFTGMAVVGLFANLFVALAGKNLDAGMASLFTNIGSVAIASSLVFFILSRKCEAQERAEKDEYYRDLDAVYRHIDDSVRDVRHDIREASRACETSCRVKK